jgi:NADH-quinone oxidoreductase subunit F
MGRFEAIRAEAVQKWREVDQNPLPLIMVGTATCGLAQGAKDVVEALMQGAKGMGLQVRIMEVGCMGHCYAEPLVTVKMPGRPPYLYGNVTPAKGELILRNYIRDGDPYLDFIMGSLEPDAEMPPVWDLPRFYHEERILLDLCGRIDPNDIDHYITNGGYEAALKALSMCSSQIIERVERSGLRGRGGAGFPTARKWLLCAEQPSDIKVVICNADEGDPGAYMDRAILESNPHQVIEGMIIAARSVGATNGYIYIRAEYPLAVRVVKEAVRQASQKGLLGDDILGSGVDSKVEVFEGSGAFVCGEETALIASMEGYRGMPRVRPPYPSQRGLHGMPTLINNVKTLALAAHILRDEHNKFSSMGTERSKGTMVFSVVGKAQMQGLVEVPMGTTLGRLVFDICGGIQDGKAFKGVQIGGPSGGCLPQALLETPIDYDSLQDAGAIMGSGGIVIMDEDDCMVEVARYFLEFTQRESCGKCTFCRVGTKQMLEILTDITQGKAKEVHLEHLKELAEEVHLGSLCNLGATAPNPVLTTLRYFRDEYEAHVQEGRCPSLHCRDLIAYYILPQRCAAGCDACVGTCPTEAVYTMKSRKKAVDQEKCVKCGECMRACPPEYSAVIKVSPADRVPPPEAPPLKRDSQGAPSGGKNTPGRV